MIKLAQGNVMNNLRNWYKAHINVPFINAPIKNLLRFSVNILALVKGIKFPPKYDWDWKLEMLLRRYEPETTILVKRILKPGMTVIDVGAHIGYYSRIFAELVGSSGKVYAFEPEPSNFHLLVQNTKMHPCVRPINEGISDCNGKIDFYRMPNNTGLHSIISAGHPGEKIEIQSATLDAFAEKENLPKIDFIKMDIEGGEPFALKGASQILSQKNLMIILEFTPGNFAFNKIDPLNFLRELRQFGFRIYTLQPRNEPQALDLQNFNLQTVMEGKESINLFLRK